MQRRGASVLDSARRQNGQTSSLRRTQRAESSCLAPASSQTARRRFTLRQRRAQLVHTSSPSWTTQRGGAGARHRCALATSATTALPAPRTHPRIRRGLGGHRPTTILPPPCHHHLATTASLPPLPHRLATTTSPPPCRHRLAATPLPPLPCRHRVAATPLPLLSCRHRLAATPLPSLPCHHRLALKASAPPNPPRESLQMQVATAAAPNLNLTAG